jgi:hypothetical protein
MGALTLQFTSKFIDPDRCGKNQMINLRVRIIKLLDDWVFGGGGRYAFTSQCVVIHFSNVPSFAGMLRSGLQEARDLAWPDPRPWAQSPI